MRYLCLDDSGKTAPKHPSRFVVFAGISFEDQEWATLHRRITGAKFRYFPLRARGRPNEWELKTENFLTPNSWRRKRNRSFCFELVDILGRSNCSVYAVVAEKARSTKPLTEDWLIPLMFHRLVPKFLDEVDQRASGMGAILCDWSSYKLDGHLSTCVGSYAVSRGYKQIVGGVTYGSSKSLTVIQAADLIAGAFRISYEGGEHLSTLVSRLSQLRHERQGARDVEGFPVNSVIRLF